MGITEDRVEKKSSLGGQKALRATPGSTLGALGGPGQFSSSEPQWPHLYNGGEKPSSMGSVWGLKWL